MHDHNIHNARERRKDRKMGRGRKRKKERERGNILTSYNLHRDHLLALPMLLFN